MFMRAILILLFVILSCNAAANTKMCVFESGGWTTDFTAATTGWTGAATAHIIAGAGSIDAAVPTSRIRNGNFVIMGQHACSTGQAHILPINTGGSTCVCRFTHINGVSMLSAWRNGWHYETVLFCHQNCAGQCWGQIQSATILLDAVLHNTGL